jgi:hypothetical protein
MREFSLSCFWDSVAHDHLLVFKRVSGDGFKPNINEFFYKLLALMPGKCECFLFVAICLLFVSFTLLPL